MKMHRTRCARRDLVAGAGVPGIFASSRSRVTRVGRTGRPHLAWYHRFVDFVSLAALVHSLPEGFTDATWLQTVLPQHWGGYAAPGLRAWSVGGVQDNETLVQSRPIVRDPRADFLADLLRVPTQTTLAAHSVRPTGPDWPPGHGEADRPLPAIAMTRFQRWVGVRAESGLDEGARAALALPDFLTRSATGQSGDREPVVFGFLAALHAEGLLGKAYTTPAQIRRALALLDERLGRPERVNVMVCDGRTVGVLHRGGRFLLLEPPAPSRPRTIQPHARLSALLLHDHQDGPAAPGASLIEPGIFTTTARQPGVLERG